MTDAINPPHYSNKLIQPYDVIAENSGIGYAFGNAVKYMSRYTDKGKPLEDLRKARWYLDKLLEFAENAANEALQRKLPTWAEVGGRARTYGNNFSGYLGDPAPSASEKKSPHEIHLLYLSEHTGYNDGKRAVNINVALSLLVQLSQVDVVFHEPNVIDRTGYNPELHLYWSHIYAQLSVIAVLLDAEIVKLENEREEDSRKPTKAEKSAGKAD